MCDAIICSIFSAPPPCLLAFLFFVFHSGRKYNVLAIFLSVLMDVFILIHFHVLIALIAVIKRCDSAQ